MENKIESGTKRYRSYQKILWTWFGLGLSPFAPGTAGTLGAIPFVILFALLLPADDALKALAGFAILVSVTGVWVSNRAIEHLQKDDPGAVVIDEVAGMSLTMLGLPVTGMSLLLGFLLFRVIDIAKLPPLSWCERLPRGWGVMMDDIVGGIIACGLLHLLYFFQPNLFQIF